MKTRIILRIIIFLVLTYSGSSSARAEISVTLINFKEHPRDIAEQKEALKIVFPPETEINYLDWENPNAQRILGQIEAETLPQVVYESGIEKSEVFLTWSETG